MDAIPSLPKWLFLKLLSHRVTLARANVLRESSFFSLIFIVDKINNIENHTHLHAVWLKSGEEVIDAAIQESPLHTELQIFVWD